MPEPALPPWAKEHDVVAEIEQGDVKFIVPPSVRDRFINPLAAVPAGCSPNLAKAILAC